MNNSKAHQELQGKIMLAVGSLSYIRVWERRVGLATPIGTDRKVYYGVKGEADIQGIIYPGGRALAIEVKTGNAVLSEDQRTWRAMFIKFGGLYIEARSVEDVIKSL